MHDLSATEQARSVKAGEISARELTDHYLARIERFDADLGAYLRVDAEGARRAADAVDAAVARGDDPGPLAGVPLGLKDVLVTEGLETTAASKILSGFVPPYDGTAVARLRAAGAVVVGKLNCDEFAMGSSNENSAAGPCRNPWDPERVPGGSSGGSAAAVAAGLCGAALGTDTGGSIRQPASFCGVVGLKPTYGRVSRYGVIAYASSLDQVGPMTATVEDAALLYGCIAGFDPRDATSLETAADAPESLRQSLAETRSAATPLDGIRVGLPREYFGDGLADDVRRCIDTAIASLRDRGATVTEVSLPHSEYVLPTYYLIATAEASSNLARYDGVRYGARGGDADSDLLDMYCKTRGAGFGDEVKRRIMLGTFALRAGYYDQFYGKAQQARALIKRDFDTAFETVDVIASAASPTAAFRAGSKTSDPLAMYLMDVFTLSCNLAGLPGLSVPCGLTDDGLPVGLQLLGRPLDEASLLKVAAAYEHSAGRAARPARYFEEVPS